VKPHPAVPKAAGTLAELLEEMRALALQESPQRAAVDRAFVAAASIMKQQPRDAPVILRKCLPLVMHAATHVQRGAAEGVLKLLDLAAALPDDVVDEAMPVLAQLLDFSIGKWSFSQSTYRFARFPRLRQRILDAALEIAVAERNHTNPAVAVMALHDVIGGLQKCNAFDEPQVADAFARYALGQSNADVQRAVVAYLLEPAPHVVARVLDARPELFPPVEDLHVYGSEERGHMVDLRPHDARVAGLGQIPVANIELFLLDDAADPARRMAAAMAVPHIPDKAARARLLAQLRCMLDKDTKHVGICEGQHAQPEHFWTRTIALPPLTKLLADVDNPTVALDALRVATPRNVAATLLPLARCCERAAASAWLAAVAANAPEAHHAAAVRWNAFDVLCNVEAGRDNDDDDDDDDVIFAARALARDIASSTPDERQLVHGLHVRLPEVVEAHGPTRLAPLLQAWPATMAMLDVAHNLRLFSYRALQKSKHASAIAASIDEAKRVLVDTAKTDKPLAESLLIVPL
jgi:hypothetical protein